MLRTRNCREFKALNANLSSTVAPSLGARGRRKRLQPVTRLFVERLKFFNAAETSSSLAAGSDCIKMEGNYSNKNLCVETSKLFITSNRRPRTKKFAHLRSSLSEN